MFGTSNTAIANHLGISRQAVTKHRRKGMPCDSLECASAWYHANVSVSRRKRGTFSFLPRRVPSFAFDDDEASARAIADLVADQEDAPDFQPKAVKLDRFPDGFWGESATRSILEILGRGKTAVFRKPQNILAAFFCIAAAQRLHLRLMPSMVAPLLVGLRDQDEIERQLLEWSIAFAERWYGEDFEAQPILPEGIEKLSDFFRPLEAKECPPPRARRSVPPP